MPKSWLRIQITILSLRMLHFAKKYVTLSSRSGSVKIRFHLNCRIQIQIQIQIRIRIQLFILHHELKEKLKINPVFFGNERNINF